MRTAGHSWDYVDPRLLKQIDQLKLEKSRAVKEMRNIQSLGQDKRLLLKSKAFEQVETISGILENKQQELITYLQQQLKLNSSGRFSGTVAAQKEEEETMDEQTHQLLEVIQKSNQNISLVVQGQAQLQGQLESLSKGLSQVQQKYETMTSRLRQVLQGYSQRLRSLAQTEDSVLLREENSILRQQRDQLIEILTQLRDN